MNYFDRSILEFFNEFSQRSWTFDHTIKFLTGTNLVKGGIFLAVIWALWFERNKEEVVVETRRTILATITGSLLALFFARVLASVAPFRFRPLHQPGLSFRLPLGSHVETLDGWSSFPSDHASLFAALATGIFLISRRTGLFSIFYALLIILIPRIYRGFHYPTDILAGILLGSVCVLLTNGTVMRKKLSDPLLEWSEKSPQLFYATFFLLSYQMANLFDDIRRVSSYFW